MSTGGLLGPLKLTSLTKMTIFQSVSALSDALKTGGVFVGLRNNVCEGVPRKGGSIEE